MTDEDLRAHIAAVLLAGPGAAHMLPASTLGYMLYELASKRMVDVGGPDFGRLAQIAHIRQPGPAPSYAPTPMVRLPPITILCADEMEDLLRPAPTVPVPAGPVMVLRLSLLPLLNETKRWNPWEYSRRTRALAWEVRVEIIRALGAMPTKPLAKASILVERYSTKTPDHDGLVGGAKQLLDVLQPYVAPPTKIGKDGKRATGGRPYGQGVIAGDDPARLSAEYRHVQCRKGEACTIVTITGLA